MNALVKETSAPELSNRSPRAAHAPSHAPPSLLTPPPTIQRKAACACGGGCPSCREGEGPRLQTKLRIGHAADPAEREADALAERVMTMPASAHATSPASESASASSSSHAADAPHTVLDVLRTPGEPLDTSARGFFEPRFGRDLAHVRVHSDRAAADSARDIDARAYTFGRHVVFGAGEYAPSSDAGRLLIAHELAHAVRQGGGPGADSSAHVVRRSVTGHKPVAKKWAGAPPRCGSDFCNPFPTQQEAKDDRDVCLRADSLPLFRLCWDVIKAGIAQQVSSRVVPLWDVWASGGVSSALDLTKDFGGDFTASKTTFKTTAFLVGELKKQLKAGPPALAPGASVKLDIPTLIPDALKAIDTPKHKDEMNFNVADEIPGNIAGGVAKDQAANPIGSKPSSQNDERTVKGLATAVKLASGELFVIPVMTYTVKDTLDLCPGDCGAPREQIATIPMSRWEASGISGDVPFKVDFPAAATPFMLPAPASPAPPAPPAPAAPPPAAPPAPEGDDDR